MTSSQVSPGRKTNHIILAATFCLFASGPLLADSRPISAPVGDNLTRTARLNPDYDS